MEPDKFYIKANLGKTWDMDLSKLIGFPFRSEALEGQPIDSGKVIGKVISAEKEGEYTYALIQLNDPDFIAKISDGKIIRLKETSEIEKIMQQFDQIESNSNPKDDKCGNCGDARVFHIDGGHCTAFGTCKCTTFMPITLDSIESRFIPGDIEQQ